MWGKFALLPLAVLTRKAEQFASKTPVPASIFTSDALGGTTGLFLFRLYERMPAPCWQIEPRPSDEVSKQGFHGLCFSRIRHDSRG
jgi:hypothetical protein